MNKNNKFKKEILFYPAYDLRSKGGGIHGVEMRWHLIGEHGVVQFVVFTSWMLPETQKEIDAKFDGPDHFLHKPMAADLGYHARTPRYSGQTATANCNVLSDEESCYYDGSGLNAEPVFEILLRKGSDGVWKYLENYYKKTFKKEIKVSGKK